MNEGMITTSWNGKATAEDVLVSLVIRATEDKELSEVSSGQPLRLRKLMATATP
ncbi:MAG: hypothetical protein R2795_15765 [Saprospiraceae bacterium]